MTTTGAAFVVPGVNIFSQHGIDRSTLFFLFTVTTFGAPPPRSRVLQRSNLAWSSRSRPAVHMTHASFSKADSNTSGTLLRPCESRHGPQPLPHDPPPPAYCSIYQKGCTEVKVKTRLHVGPTARASRQSGLACLALPCPNHIISSSILSRFCDSPIVPYRHFGGHQHSLNLPL